MRISFTEWFGVAIGICGCLAVASAASPAPAQGNLLANGGFEHNSGLGTVPAGWQVDDELSGYLGWIAPRAERRVGDIGPRTGRYMIGLDSEQLGIDSNGEDYETPRAAIRQTVKAAGGTEGTFSVYYNDIDSTGLAYISVIRLAYTINHADIRSIRMPPKEPAGAPKTAMGSGVWSKPMHRVSQRLPLSHTAFGDWTLGSIPVAVPPGNAVAITVWIGVFDNQSGTEVGYWRIDDARLEMLPIVPAKVPVSRPAIQTGGD